MKIGILTYHRAENYGALLQAYALSTYLKGLGHEVGFVDYWPEYHKDYFRIFPRQKFKKGGIVSKLSCVYLAAIWGISRLKRKRVFVCFMRDYLGLSENAKYTDNRSVCDEFDLVVYGSDQIWRQQNLPGHKGLDLWYFGSSNVVARKIAYAASMGPSDLSNEEKEQIKQHLSAFEAISVRETSLKGLLDSLDLTSSVVVDPVLLLKREQWQQLAKKSVNNRQGKYILFYNLLNSEEAKCFANRLGKEKKLPVIEVTKKYGLSCLGSRFSHSASVPEFLSLIEGAEYVVSNSFHGVALSIIFGKQFFAVGMGKRSDRVESLLAAFRIENRYCIGGKEIPSGEIDYGRVHSEMEWYSNQSKEFLKNALLKK